VRSGALVDRMHRGYVNLGLALADAEFASTAARGLAARSIAAPTARRAAGRHRLQTLHMGSER
jgi:hypothetical protein